MDKGMDIDNPKSLGLELIRILVSQLNGTINLERSGGTAYDIVFTKDKDLD
jgi:two-component sensor histidine kinase